MHNKNDISSRCYYATILLITLLVLSGCQQQKYEKDQSIGDEIPHRISSGFRVEILDSSALDMIDPAASIKVIAEGFTWTEGPLFIPDSNYLLFSDIPENKIYRWQPGKGIDVFLEPSG